MLASPFHHPTKLGLEIGEREYVQILSHLTSYIPTSPSLIFMVSDISGLGK